MSIQYAVNQSDIVELNSLTKPFELSKLKTGLLPQKWMGKNILPIKCEGGLDLDYEWQLPQVKYLLKNGKKNSR